MIQYDWYPNNKGKFRDRHAQGKCNVKMKAETGAMEPQTKGLQGLLAVPDARRGKACISPRASRGYTALLTPWLSNFYSPEWWKNEFVKIVAIWYSSPGKLMCSPLSNHPTASPKEHGLKLATGIPEKHPGMTWVWETMLDRFLHNWTFQDPQHAHCAFWVFEEGIQWLRLPQT